MKTKNLRIVANFLSQYRTSKAKAKTLMNEGDLSQYIKELSDTAAARKQLRESLVIAK